MTVPMDTEAEDSTLQLVIDQLEELVVTLVEEIRERPIVAIALFAGLLGAFIGTRVAGRQRQSAVTRAAQRKAGDVGSAAELAGIGLQLLKNPIVRGLLIASITRQVKGRVPR